MADNDILCASNQCNGDIMPSIVRFLKVAGSRLVIASTALVVVAMPLQGLASAEGTPDGWLALGDPVIKFSELPQDYEVPYSYNYNTDCDTRDFNVITREAQTLQTYPYTKLTELRHTSACAVNTPRGMHDGEYLDAGVPAGKFSGLGGFILQVPNSNVLMSMSSGATNLDKSLSFYRAIVPAYNELTGEVQYNVVGHEYFADRSGRKLNVRPGSMGYSGDGQWMVVETVIGFARVNLKTKEIVPFASGLTYGNGTGQQPRVAISPDGRYAAVAAKNTLFRVYDLNTCAPTPDAITGPVGCQYKDIEPFLSNRFRTYNNSYYIRFASNDLLTFITSYTDASGQTKRIAVRLAPSGQTIEDVTYLALGDSFSSGEGAYDYEFGTDESSNNCHLSKKSYPYLIAQSAAITEFHNVACSGSIMDDYDNAQGDRDSNKSGSSNNSLGIWLPGVRSQKQHVTSSSGPKMLTISMSGNDLGFADKLAECVASPGTCKYASDSLERSQVAHEIANLHKPLKQLYEQIIEDTQGKTKIYVIGYPQIVSANLQCDSNVHLNGEEAIFARHATTYINDVIEAAADAAGVYYVDIEGVLESSNLCSGNVQSVNGLTAGDDILLDWWQKLPAKIATGSTSFGNESYHPNAKGHELMAAAINNATGGTIVDFNVCPDSPQGIIICPKSGVQIPSPDESYFGANAVHYVVCLNNSCELPDSQDVIIRSKSLIVEPEEPADGRLIRLKLETGLKPGTKVDVELRSEPTVLGTFTVDQYGTVDATVSVPDSVPAGYHTLHLLGQSIAGENIDYYQPVLVTGSEGDLDEDGISDNEDPCGFVVASNLDQDRDGIDDACDAEITEAPADGTAPVVAGTPDREPNENGWYNSDVAISWSVADPEPSSGAPSQPPETVASQEGVHVYTSNPSCDPLNNCAAGNLELKIDKSAPEITYVLSPAPNAQGWNNDAVTVTFACSDTTSGVASCSEPETVNATDGMYVITGSATDKAGNISGVNVFVSLDITSPTVTQMVWPAANSYGWHNTDVTITPTCEDLLSNIQNCSAAVTLTTDGTNQIIGSAATDNAGNTTAASATINIDKTAPTLGTPIWDGNPKSASGTARITLAATDNLSGIEEAEYYLGDNDPGEGNGATMQVGNGTVSVDFNTDFPTGVYKVTVRAKDKAGNWSQPIADYLVVYDPAGTRMTGKRTLLPSLAGGDILPGLIHQTQEDRAKFGFNVRYDTDGTIHKQSDFQFTYKTGERCNQSTRTTNCHSLELNASSIAWLTTQGENNSTGVFQGTATLTVDGATSNTLFRLTGLDSERLNAISDDHLTLKIYAQNANPNTDTPLYQVNAEVLRGNIKIHKR